MHRYAFFFFTLTTYNHLVKKPFKSSFLFFIRASVSPPLVHHSVMPSDWWIEMIKLLSQQDKLSVTPADEERVMWWGLGNSLTLTRCTSHAVFPPESTKNFQYWSHFRPEEPLKHLDQSSRHISADTVAAGGGSERRGHSELRGKKTQTTTRKPQNQDGGARDSISTVHGSQSPRISHPEGKLKLRLSYINRPTTLSCS